MLFHAESTLSGTEVLQPLEHMSLRAHDLCHTEFKGQLKIVIHLQIATLGDFAILCALEAVGWTTMSDMVRTAETNF